MNPVLPRTIDNTYSGPKAALWILVLVVLLKVVMSVNSTLNARTIITTADGIPLDTYSPAAAQTIVSLFVLRAASRLIFCLLCVIALIRYRSLIPAMFALLLIDHLSGQLVAQFYPIPRIGTPPGGAINLTLLGLLVLGFALSLWKRR